MPACRRLACLRQAGREWSNLNGAAFWKKLNSYKKSKRLLLPKQFFIKLNS
jgi:hypothetical protein